MTNLEHYKAAFNSVGWFIPPYVTMIFLSTMAEHINEGSQPFDQHDLEGFLSIIYSPENQAAMVTERYPVTPYIQDYKIIIQEAVQAHFLGLDHVAVAGLMPVIEGAGKKLAKSRSVLFTYITSVFINLADDCKNDAIKNNIGAVGEVVSMMESFAEFAEKHLYVNSGSYSLTDKTNRHGILHGAYGDEDYGSPINFYKCIAAVDFLCFVSAFRASISWLAPSPTEASTRLSQFYNKCMCFDRVKYTKE
jgi:hypothetical protein